ncbi:cupin domain-containing protein [Kitasatospora sp. HPMI-4]|uniref:cupin domain-containing protein n=1 Tax=Kitasatospora sp. HPMI-4 TaxID=3448443 RepID=UPI003F1DEBD7
MPSADTDVPRLLADLAERVATASPDQRGALWRLAEPGRQLDANLVRLPADGAVEEHMEPDLDVLLLVVEGSGTLYSEGRSQPLTPGALAWLPHGSRRALRASSAGLAWLTVHRRRPGMTIRSGPPADSALTAPSVPSVPSVPTVRTDEGGEGGESACWLNRVCPGCGRLAEGTAPVFCSQCGERLEVA